MEKKEKLIQKYLQEKLNADKAKKTEDCPGNGILASYLANSLEQKKRQEVENHLANCSFCLSQISLAWKALQKHKRKSFEPVPERTINKTKSCLNITKTKNRENRSKKKIIKRRLFLAATIILFILSFLIPRYFLQFLVGALILGIRWSFESESGQTLIMVLDSWRKHSHDKDNQISNRLKDQFKK